MGLPFTLSSMGLPFPFSSVGLRSLSQSSAVSLQVTEAINSAVGCLCFLPDPWLPPLPLSITAHWLVPNYTAWWQMYHVCKQLAQGCTQQRGGRDLIPRLVDCKLSSSLTTQSRNRIHVGIYSLLIKEVPRVVFPWVFSNPK